MFNAVLKIPMQFFILLLGALLFVFYQFEPPPVFFNQAEWRRHAHRTAGFRAIEAEHATAARAEASQRSAPGSRPARRRRRARKRARGPPWSRPATAPRRSAPRPRPRSLAADPRAKAKDSDYVFITFILTQLPHG